MPFAPLKPCTFAGGCPELVVRGMCEKHKKEVTKGYDRHRGSSTKRGYDSVWVKLRKKALKRDQYLCQHCLLYDDRMVPATDVDHIIPFTSNDDPLRLDLENLQSLCETHHSRKTMKEDGGGGHARKPRF